MQSFENDPKDTNKSSKTAMLLLPKHDSQFDKYFLATLFCDLSKITVTTHTSQ